MRLARSLRIRAGIPLLIMSAVAAVVTSACGAAPAAQPTTAPAPAAAPSAQPAAAPSPATRPALASPVASPSPPSGSPTQASTSSGPGEEYEVKAGDTLLLISQQFYGDVSQWRKIYDANRDVIGADPDKLALGMKLKIPPKDG